MEISERMNDLLKKDGARTWMDDEKTKGGDNLPEEICNALDWCEMLVIVWSEAASKSKWVKAEWTSVFNEKRIIPCCLDKTKLPRLLKNNLYIDFRNFGNGYRRLLKSLGLVTQAERVYVDEGVKVRIGEPRSNEIFCAPSAKGIEISLKGNAKVIDAFGLDVRFDPSVLRFNGVEKGAFTEGWAVSGKEISVGVLKIGGFAGSGKSIKDGSEGSIALVKFKGFREGLEKDITIENFTGDVEGMRFVSEVVERKRSDLKRDREILQKLKQPLREFNQMNRFPDNYRAPKCLELASLIEREAENIQHPEFLEIKAKLLEYARRKEQINQNTGLKILMNLFQKRVEPNKFEPLMLCEEIDRVLKITSVSAE